MNKEILFLYANHVRLEIEKHKNFHSHKERNMTVFPKGCCDEASWILWKYFSEKWISWFKRMHVSWWDLSRDISHVWLENDEFSIDITGDQFNGWWNYHFNPVVVIPREKYFFNEIIDSNVTNSLNIKSQPSDGYESFIVGVEMVNQMNITDFYGYLVQEGLLTKSLNI